jgi:hypothetical protein
MLMVVDSGYKHAGMTVQGKGHLKSYRQQIVDLFEITPTLHIVLR